MTVSTTMSMPTVVIACIGSRFDWVPADIVDRLSRSRSHEQYRFVNGDWLSGEWPAARAAWVVDRSVTPRDVRPALEAGLPLLVPEGNTALRDLCVREGCGLYYLVPDDAEACLHRLMQDDGLRSALSANCRSAASRI